MVVDNEYGLVLAWVHPIVSRGAPNVHHLVPSIAHGDIALDGLGSEIWMPISAQN